MKSRIISVITLIIMLITIGVLPVEAKDFNITYKEGNYPLITDEHEHLAYQLNSQSNKLFAFNWKMTDPYITTYYVFGAIDKTVENESVKTWINTSFASKIEIEENNFITTMGWNTGVIYNGADYVMPSDVNTYKNAINIASRTEENIGLAIKTEFKFRNEGQLLEVLYHVKNNSSSAKDFLLWSGGDTELALNDHCTIGKITEQDARGVYLYSADDEYTDYPDSANVQMPIFATANDSVVQFWNTDRWSDIRDMYNRSDEEKWATSLTELLSKGPSYIANIAEGQKPEDTASLWYWPGQNLKAGEEKVYSVLIGITNFTDNVENNIIDIIRDANTEIEDETYEITFNLSGIKDGGTIPSQTIDSRDKRITRPETPIHEGNMIFDDWYTDDSYQTKFDFENTVVTDNTEIFGRWKLPPGNIKIVDPTTKPDVSAEILTSLEDITSIIPLTQAEEAAKEAGKDISIYVEINDASEDVSDADKAALEEELGDKTEIGTYLDIGLFKKVDGEEPTKISKSNSPIKISLEIPEELKNTDPNVERTYRLVKMENGELVEIDVEMEDGNLIFETDDFSIYALAYVDKKMINPNTIDGAIMYLFVLVMSALVIRTICKKIKKTREAN